MAQKIANRTLDAIQAADWDEIYPRAIKFAMSKLSFRMGSPREGVPKKEEAHDIVNEAIKKIISACGSEDGETKRGLRKWDPDRGPLDKFLFSVIKSDISHLYDSEEYKRTSRMPIDEENNEEDPAGMEEQRRTYLPEKHSEQINPERVQSPEEIRVEIEIRNGLLKAVEGDGELEGIVLCMLDGLEKPGDIAEELGIETRVMNNAKKRLRRKYGEILPRRK